MKEKKLNTKEQIKEEKVLQEMLEKQLSKKEEDLENN